MLLDKFVEVKIINHNLKHYQNLGYNVKCGDNIQVKPKELSSGSHYLVNCKCDSCENETNIKYQDYLKVFNKNNKYFCEKCRHNDFHSYNTTKKELMKDNRLKSTQEKYGVDNVFQLETVKDKIKETCIEKYGVSHYRQNEDVKEKEKIERIKNGTQIPDDKMSQYEKYRKQVHKYTRLEVKKLYDSWNGLDYYDDEYIGDNKKLHFNDDKYPTIDHKLSIKNGFLNNIEPCEIGSIYNLCITKRYYNLSKGSLYEFPKFLINNS
jgi:hypothetical protein